jgi:hypothetical protein
MDTAESLTSYHQEGIFWALIGAFLLSFVDWERKVSRKNYLLFTCAGLCSSVSFFTKQTSGAGATLALLIVIAVLSMSELGPANAIQRIAAFCVGWAVPATALLWWLQSKGALTAFLKIIFLQGHTAKGSLRVIFLRAFDLLFIGPVPLRILSLSCSLIFMMMIVRLAQVGVPGQPHGESLKKIAIVGASGLASLFIGSTYCALFLHGSLFIFLMEWVSIYLGFLGSLALTIYYLKVMYHRNLEIAERQRFLLVTFSIFICYTLSWGWKFWGPMAFPCLGVMIALGLEDLASVRKYRILRYCIAAYAMLLLSIFEAGKTTSPFQWEGWADSPVYQATSTSSQPFLNGIHLPAQTAGFVDDLTNTIQKYSKPREPIFIYSYQPLWYVLADRWPPTYAQVHLFDVAPDDICRADTDRLVKARPKVIIDFTSDHDLDVGEMNFRGGQTSGQRYLYSQMYRLINADYRLEKVFNISATAEPVKVFVLRTGS